MKRKSCRGAGAGALDTPLPDREEFTRRSGSRLGGSIARWVFEVGSPVGGRYEVGLRFVKTARNR